MDSFASGVVDGLAKYRCGPLRHDFSGAQLAVGSLTVQMCIRCPRLEVGEETCSFCDNAAQTSVDLRDGVSGLSGRGQLCDNCRASISANLAEAFGWSMSGARRMRVG
ncbi:MAG: hypothetical protein ACRDG3_12205 [Tepidiformaceae bacterium]